VDAISKDLLMPLLNPLVRGGNWQNLVIPYFGGDLAIGKIFDVILNSLIVGWALFFIIKAINRSQRTLESGMSTFKESANAKQGNPGD
jgi:large conductance mechanosensitive channel